MSTDTSAYRDLGTKHWRQVEADRTMQGLWSIKVCPQMLQDGGYTHNTANNATQIVQKVIFDREYVLERFSRDFIKPLGIETEDLEALLKDCVDYSLQEEERLTKNLTIQTAIALQQIHGQTVEHWLNVIASGTTETASSTHLLPVATG